MTEKRYYVNSAGYLCDIDLSNTLSIFECADRLNELTNENEQLKQCNEKLDEKYGRMLMEYNGLSCEYTELKEENEQLKSQLKEFKLLGVVENTLIYSVTK